MAITRLGGANAITGTIPQGNIANASLGAVTALPAGVGGKVLQVVTTTKTDTQTISTATATQITGLTASLTCSSTSNKVFITGFISMGGTSNDAGYEIYAASSVISGAEGDSASNRRTITFGGGLWTGGNHQYRLLSIPFSYLHSPSSTSAITYSIYKSDSGATSTYINRSQQDGDNTDRTRGISTITLMEIAG